MQLEISDDEAALLRDMLANDLSNLREEIYKTENRDMHQALKRNEELLTAIVKRLGATPAA